MTLAVATTDTVGGLLILTIVALVAITDRARRCRPSGRRAGAAGLPDTARHRGRVEVGTYAAAEARTGDGRGATPGVRPSAAAPCLRYNRRRRCERPRA